MALWPFGNNKDKKKAAVAGLMALAAEEERAEKEKEAARKNREEKEAAQADAGAEQHTPDVAPPAPEGVPDGEYTGPFDGDSLDINQFDFRDFARSYLNLGSLRIPMPENTQVQVEMAETAPRKLHIISPLGRITPVAFAAAPSSSLWDETRGALLEGMRKDGLTAEEVQGPWGPELVGRGKGGVVRVIAVDAPRWMLRFILLGREDSADELLTLGRELVARTFVYRGTDPILAGEALPVRLPMELVEQLQKAVMDRAKQQQAEQGAGEAPAEGEQPGAGDAPGSAQ